VVKKLWSGHKSSDHKSSAVLQTVDDNSPDVNSASGGGNTEKLTPMSTVPFEAAGDFIAFRDLFLDGEDDIGKAARLSGNVRQPNHVLGN
jgi:hypothetical protein